MSREKTDRNKEMFREWYSAFRTFTLTAQEKDRIPYTALAKKYGISYPTVREIIQRELKAYLKKRGVKI